jgi:DNA-binding FrmR family transcriptional regulator
MAQYDETPDAIKKNVLGRLKKIEGQIRGIYGMVDSGKECEDILIQVRAVKSALRSMNSLILKRYLMRCYQEIGESPDNEEFLQKMEKTVKVLSNFIDG